MRWENEGWLHMEWLPSRPDYPLNLRTRSPEQCYRPEWGPALTEDMPSPLPPVAETCSYPSIISPMIMSSRSAKPQGGVRKGFDVYQTNFFSLAEQLGAINNNRYLSNIMLIFKSKK
jgi:hypothetical protein